MTIQAYMPVFNEADVLPYCLTHLLLQGVRVHVIDGWSNDGSYEIARSFPGVTVERFPAEGPAEQQVCRELLRRIEDLAALSGADWCMINDADEWRRSSRSGETLAQGIARVQAAGPFNVIDHEVFAFFCTDDEWTGNPEAYFRHYNTTDLICTLQQEKIWKNAGRVSFQHSGGHDVKFADGIEKRVFHEKFIMKHYPFRTPEQARRKIATRLERRCHEEHQNGWGRHYDFFEPGFSFCWDPQRLREWPSQQEAVSA